MKIKTIRLHMAGIDETVTTYVNDDSNPAYPPGTIMINLPNEDPMPKFVEVSLKAGGNS
jgi:hypothetical protein